MNIFLKHSFLAGLFALLCMQPAMAAEEDAVAKVNSKFQPRQGTITLQKGLAVLNIPPSLGYLTPEQAQLLIEKVWGNPAGSGEGTLGLIVPANMSVLSPDYWGIVITYTEDGYVKDDDAEKIDYAKLLGEMQEDTKAASKERKEAGYPPIELLGWAEPPRYDKAAHKMYWAKELKFGDSPKHELNYDVRILGRRGVLVLTAVAGMDQLPMIQKQTPQILAMVNFNDGHRYADFDPTTDKIATYGLTALVAGGVLAAAAKVGLFKGLFLFLLAGKKFVILGLIAFAAYFRKFFGRKQP